MKSVNHCSAFLLIGLLTIAMQLVGCSSALTIKSTPSDSEVSVRQMGKVDTHSIGKTPIVTGLSDLPEAVAGAQVLEVTVSKPGYLPKTVFLTETRSVDITVDIKLEKEIVEDKAPEFNAIIDGLFESQKAAQRGDIKSAHKILDSLERLNKEIAAIHEIRGGVFVLEKNIPMALRSFSRALELNPKSPDVRTIVRSLGGDPSRLPAAAESTNENPKTPEADKQEPSQPDEAASGEPEEEKSDQ